MAVEALAWAQKREAFGATLIEQGVVRHKFGHMVRQAEALQAWTEQIIYELNHLSDKEGTWSSHPVSLPTTSRPQKVVRNGRDADTSCCVGSGERNRLCSASDCLHTRRTRCFHLFDCTHCVNYVHALPVRPIQPIRGLHFPNLSLINCSFPNDVDTLGLRRYRTLDACVDH